jgi:hypothetical protein
MKLTLVRVGSSHKGTFGVLRFLSVPFALTLELPWLNNEMEISCIPAGLYTCQFVRSPKFGPTYEIMNVPGRSHVLFHKGNTVEDTHGCILVAEEFGGTFDNPTIVSSQKGFAEFMALVSGQQTFELDIVDASQLATINERVTI